MKQVTNRIVDLFKGLKSSATLGQQDSLIELPNRTMSVLELPGPLKNANAAGIAPTTVIGDSTYIPLEQFRAGAGILSQIFSNQILDAGLWHITGHVSMSWVQGAVPAAAKGLDVGLQDPDGFTIVLALVSMVTLSGAVTYRIDQILSLDRPGWRFINQIPATLAADTVDIRNDLVANKLL